MNDILKQEEIDDLLGKDSHAQGGEQDPTLPSDYDFSVQPNLMQHRFSHIETVFEKFLRRFKTTCHQILKRTVEVTVKPMALTPSKDFISTLSIPTNINIINMNPFKGHGLICLDARLVYAIVENYFGGDGKIQGMVEGREFTATEYRVLQKLLGGVFQDMNASWEALYKIQHEFVKTESDPVMLTWINPHELMLIKRFRIELEGGGGDMVFALPISLFDPIKNLLEEGDSQEVIKNDQAWTNALQHEILEANIDINCILANRVIKLKEVVAFKEGDVIPIEINETSVVHIADIPVYKVKFGTHEGNYAVKIIGKMKRE